MDPAVIIGALATAIGTVASLFYRHLLKERDECKAEAAFWRDRALTATGLAEIATDVAERARSVK